MLLILESVWFPPVGCLQGGLATRGFIVQPSLPDGLRLDRDTGVIEGIPTTPTPTDDGVPQRFTVWVDAGEQSLELKLAILVQPAAGSSWFSWLTKLLLAIGTPFYPCVTLWLQRSSSSSFSSVLLL